MPKRKRIPEDEDGSASNASINEGRPKRRRNDTTLLDTIQYIFDALRNKKKEDDTYLCEAFLRIPKRKTEPQYYEVIKKPIDMLKIQQKMKTDVYNDVEEFYADVEILIENAKLYYAKSTDEYKDAVELWEIFSSAKDKAQDEVNRIRQSQESEESTKTPKRGRGRPPKSIVSSSAPMVVEEDGTEMTMQEAIEELFGAIVTASDQEDRSYSYDFLLLPAPEKYPKYYQVIQQPIDLKTIALHIQDNHYENLDSLEKDLNMMFENACTFNEPGSRIFKDARTLRHLTRIRKEDLLLVLNAKKSVRLKCKQAPEGKKWSVLVANLQEGEILPLPSDDNSMDISVAMGTNEDDESDEDVDVDSPFWQLFLAAKNLAAPNDTSYLLCEPFRRLPNRRWHSDYYQEIKNPISMSQIRKKLRKSDYHYLSELVEDFNLMLDNAQKYNRPDSRIYRDAVKLQKFILSKAEDLPEVEEEVDSDMDSDESESQIESRRKLTQSTRPWTFKRRAKLLFKTLMDFMTDDGRQPIVAFIELPPRKDYPNYYSVINDPIDMEMIEAKIKSDQYANDDELIADFRLMFRNCQTYNEEGSQIHADADILEKVLNDKLGELQMGGEIVTSSKAKLPKKTKYSHYLTMTKNIKLLYNAIRDYRDEEDRQLSEIFLKLPLKTLYPDYYEVIKQPIDLERILHKWKSGAYTSLDDIMADLTLMFLNACRYNEPESQIYRDALTLQRLALQKRLELSSKDECVPNVQGLVQELLMSLFISVFNHKITEGSYTSDSFAELSDYDVLNGQKTRALSFDIMKRRLDKGLYTRLDQFQDDIFSVFERARKTAKRDSNLYSDSVILQKVFLKVRDELCASGTILKSRALLYSGDTLARILLQEESSPPMKSENSVPPSQDDNSMDLKDEDTSDGITEDEDSKPSEGTSNCVCLNEVQYYVGDFVYLTPPEKNFDYPILHIQRLFTNNEGQQTVYGCRYYRPAETFHLPTRKFYEQEVFKTEIHLGVPLTEIMGKCVVMSGTDYTRMEVENFDAKDIYVCDTRYSARNRFFKKIKAWPFSISENITIKERAEPVELKRVDSVYKERIDKHKEELAEVEEETKIIRSPVPNVLRFQESENKIDTMYQQYNASFGPIKLGDFVYVRSVGIKSVRHIVRIWVTLQGNAYIAGTKYVHAYDVSAVGDRKPYKQEVYFTPTQETVPLSDVISKCSVLHIKEYLTLRHTEVPENDVFVCDKFFDEMNSRICPLQSGIHKFDLPAKIHPDEVYFFWRPLDPQKFECTVPAVAKKPRIEPVEPENEDSMDGRPASVTSADSSLPATPKPVIKKTSTTGRTSQSGGRKQITGYILFSAEIRKTITQRNPEANFGEISRLVGIEWKRLTDAERHAFENRAHQMNLESAEKAQAQAHMVIESSTPGSTQVSKGAAEMPLPSNPDVVFECLWDSCDVMFEDLADLYDHLVGDPTGHVQKVHTVYECSWRGCSRHKKTTLAPFPLLQRLLRHMREVHIIKNTGRIVPHHERSRNFTPSSRRSILNDINTSTTNTASSSPAPGILSSALSAGRDNQYQITFGAPIQVNGVNGVNGNKTTDPLFVNPPPKTQRLLHSEAYIKYIENLEKPFVGQWERQLSANSDNTVIGDTGRLPANWLTNGVGNHGSVINALWALREYMMKDSLGIAKIL